MDLSQVRWFKSSRSGSATNCVEVAFGTGAVGVRDSKNPAGPALVLAADVWAAFAAGIKAGVFDAA